MEKRFEQYEHDYQVSIKNKVEEIFRENSWDRANVTLSQFAEEFQKGRLAQIAPEAAAQPSVVEFYFKLYSRKGKMGVKEFTNFYAMYYLEGVLLTRGMHPLLSVRYNGDRNLLENDVASRYWRAVRYQYRQCAKVLNVDTTGKRKMTYQELNDVISSFELARHILNVQKKPESFIDGIVRRYWNAHNGDRGIFYNQFKLIFADMEWYQLQTLSPLKLIR